MKKNYLTEERIKAGIYWWGIYPALALWVEINKKEDSFTDAVTLWRVLNNVMFGNEWRLSAKVDNESVNKVYQSILSGIDIQNTMPDYFDDFKKFLFQNNEY